MVYCICVLRDVGVWRMCLCLSVLSMVNGMMSVLGRGATSYVGRVGLGIAKGDITCIGGVETHYPCGGCGWGWCFPMAKFMDVSTSL